MKIVNLNDLDGYFDILKETVAMYVNKNDVMAKEYSEHKTMMLVLNSLNDNSSIKIEK